MDESCVIVALREDVDAYRITWLRGDDIYIVSHIVLDGWDNELMFLFHRLAFVARMHCILAISLCLEILLVLVHMLLVSCSFVVQSLCWWFMSLMSMRIPFLLPLWYTAIFLLPLFYCRYTCGAWWWLLVDVMILLQDAHWWDGDGQRFDWPCTSTW